MGTALDLNSIEYIEIRGSTFRNNSVVLGDIVTKTAGGGAIYIKHDNKGILGSVSALIYNSTFRDNIAP